MDISNIYRNPSMSVEIIQGQRGMPGKDGYTPVKGKDYFDGYTPVKGVDYFDGEKGEDGYTPVKGVDYFTDAEIAEMKQEFAYDDTVLRAVTGNIKTEENQWTIESDAKNMLTRMGIYDLDEILSK